MDTIWVYKTLCLKQFNVHCAPQSGAKRAPAAQDVRNHDSAFFDVVKLFQSSIELFKSFSNTIEL